MPRYDRNDDPHLLAKGGAATGVILKGDYNRYYFNTIFNTSVYGQGELCAVTSPLDCPECHINMTQQNRNSEFRDSVNHRITGQSGPQPRAALFRMWENLLELPFEQLRLRDPLRFDFRPAKGSPLCGAGSGGHDIGAYRSDDTDPWVPGCTFHPSCKHSAYSRPADVSQLDNLGPEILETAGHA